MSKARDIASAAPAPSTVSATELGYLDGVTSAVQTQIDSKQAVVSGVNDTEIGYLDGVTSAIQTQLNARVPASTITTKGDLIVGTGSGTYVRQGVGTDGQVLVADSAQADGVNWATPAAGGITQIATTTASATSSVVFSSIPSTYQNLYVVFTNFIPQFNGDPLRMKFNGVSSASYINITTYGTSNDNNFGATEIQVTSATRNASAAGIGHIFIPNYTNTVSMKMCETTAFTRSSITAANMNVYRTHALFNSTSAITSITFDAPSAATFSGVFTLYGIK
jgi:hypothetical protein